MASIQIHPMIQSISQSMGDMVFYTRRGRTFIRRRPRPNNPDTQAQRQARGALGAAVQAWKKLDLSEKTGWNILARAENRSGYHLFLSVNVPRGRNGQELIVKPLQGRFMNRPCRGRIL